MFLSNLKSLDIVAQFFLQVASKSNRSVFFILLDTTSIVLLVSKKLDFAAREHVKHHVTVTWFKLNESAFKWKCYGPDNHIFICFLHVHFVYRAWKLFVKLFGPLMHAVLARHSGHTMYWFLQIPCEFQIITYLIIRYAATIFKHCRKIVW